MTRPQTRELFAERPIRSDFYREPRGPKLNIRRLAFLLALVALAIGGGFGISHFVGSEENTSGELPHVVAELPLKEKPENPGGIDIPHQDVQVFQQLDNKAPATDRKTGVEHLLPAPETPQPVPAEENRHVAAPDSDQGEKLTSRELTEVKPVEETLPPPITEAVPPAVVSKPDPEPVVEKTKPVEKPVAEKKAAEPKPIQVKEAPVPKTVKTVAKPATSETTNPPDKVDQALARLPKELFTTGALPETTVPTSSASTNVDSSSGKMARVQLASFPDETAAQGQLKKLQGLYGSVVGASLTVVKADVAGKGTFYRIMSSPMLESKARSVCSELSKKKAACLVSR